ncbi:hypothetical protein [Nocardia crassostreae]|uniref:hypothetical protein n=1 Tax=Nocardia crassostreae TaxID=53428 RepID=UPI000B2AB2C0|nr:hypothetical protein [Nocardia crassostreae]
MTTVVGERRAGREITTGLSALLGFALRRERFTLPCWLLGAAALLAFHSVGSQRFYDTPQKLAALRETMSASAATVAMGGPTRLLDTIGGEILFEIFAYLAIVIALMNMFLVGRHTRSDEETGRAELVRSSRVGRRAPAAAALALAVLADAAAVPVLFVAAVATGLLVAGSLLLGLAVAGVGLTFAGVTAVAAQIFENPRSVYGSVTLILAAAYVLRAVGDVGADVFAWLSPIGWGQRTYPYVTDQWWPLALFALAALGQTAMAFALLDRRDFGAGLLPYGKGRAHASWALGSPLSLAWRLQRGSLIGWGGRCFHTRAGLWLLRRQYRGLPGGQSGDRRLSARRCGGRGEFLSVAGGIDDGSAGHGLRHHRRAAGARRGGRWARRIRAGRSGGPQHLARRSVERGPAR